MTTEKIRQDKTREETKQSAKIRGKKLIKETRT